MSELAKPLPPDVPAQQHDQTILFVRQVYDTQQAVIRQLDVKAGVMIAALALLLTSTLSIAKDISPKLHMHGKGSVTSWILAVSILLFIGGFVYTAWWVQDTLLPRDGDTPTAPGHMYSLEILNHQASSNYHQSLIAISQDELLIEITRNIYELSGIAKEKMLALRRAHIPIFLSLAAWAVSVVSSLVISSWK